MMNLPARFLCAASLALAMLAPCAALADPPIIYLVRHGEKKTADTDPELTAAGRARAQNIATMLEKTGIRSIFSSATMRTRQTPSRWLRVPAWKYKPTTRQRPRHWWKK